MRSDHLPLSSTHVTLRGIDYVRGSLNWGPLTFLNAFYKTFGWWTQRRTDYGEAFHTYALEWDSSFLYALGFSCVHRC